MHWDGTLYYGLEINMGTQAWRNLHRGRALPLCPVILLLFTKVKNK